MTTNPVAGCGAPVWVDYTNHRGERGIRQITPLSLTWRTSEWHKEDGPQYIVFGYDHGKEDYREFAWSGFHGIYRHSWDMARPERSDVVVERATRALLEERAAQKGEPACFQVEGGCAQLCEDCIAQAEVVIMASKGLNPHGGWDYQSRTHKWMLATFPAYVLEDKLERCQRFFEEAAELVQAGGMSREDAHALVDYSYDNPVGEVDKEVGGVFNTLSALCIPFGVDLVRAAEAELARVWTIKDKIREKWRNKPIGSAIPVSKTPFADVPLAEYQNTRECDCTNWKGPAGHRCACAPTPPERKR